MLYLRKIYEHQIWNSEALFDTGGRASVRFAILHDATNNEVPISYFRPPASALPPSYRQILHLIQCHASVALNTRFDKMYESLQNHAAK